MPDRWISHCALAKGKMTISLFRLVPCKVLLCYLCCHWAGQHRKCVSHSGTKTRGVIVRYPQVTVELMGYGNSTPQKKKNPADGEAEVKQKRMTGHSLCSMVLASSDWNPCSWRLHSVNNKPCKLLCYLSDAPTTPPSLSPATVTCSTELTGLMTAFWGPGLLRDVAVNWHNMI